MRCLLCQDLYFSLVCPTCQKTFLKQNKSTRTLSNSLKVYSFYGYKDIETLLHTKHNFIGSFVYKILAENSFKQFPKEFEFPNGVYALACDDHIKSGYSHTAILSGALKSKNIKPIFSKLRAQNSVNYSGKSLQYREQNPRNFTYSYKKGIDAILVDDIITTGTTLIEASELLKKEGVNVLFALALSDARR